MRKITEDEAKKLDSQNARGLLSQFHQQKLERESGKNWDKFYKRNGDRFFKDRHWTTREFFELVDCSLEGCSLLEVGCGVGNFFYPLLEDGLKIKVHACDVSPRAIDFVKKHKLYNPENINAFVCDVTKDNLVGVEESSVDVTSLIFVLSAILPSHFKYVIEKLFKITKPGGLLMFRDYGVFDMAMIRFGPGSKLSERLYVRQDGTRAYYFTTEELNTLFTECGFKVLSNEYIHRRTVNLKENVDAERVFVQVKCQKQSEESLNW